jgi:hypothetical protein
MQRKFTPTISKCRICPFFAIESLVLLGRYKVFDLTDSSNQEHEMDIVCSKNGKMKNDYNKFFRRYEKMKILTSI